MAFTFHTGPYPTVGVPNTTTTGHDGTDGSIKTGAGKLILSSSANIIHVSASLDLGTTPERAYHIRAVNANLVLSSSAGSYVYASGNLTVEQALLVKGDSVLSGNVVVGGQIYDLNSNLILSSSVGSVIAASGSLDFPQTDKTYHIRAVNSHLVLSSSAGSIIAASGNFNVYNTFNATGPAGTTHQFGNNTNFASTVSFAGLMTLSMTSAASLNASARHLVLSCSAGSIVSLSASQDFANSDKAYHIRAANSHLILSSSAGSIVQISGGLLLAGTYTSSTLPTAPPTGSIVYVSDLGFAAIYVNSVDKYMRISSGTF